MIQSHSLILWRQPDRDSKDSVDLAFETLQVLKEFGGMLNPRYVTARRKREANEFSGDYQQYIDLVSRNVNKEGKTALPDLGSTVSFFSSMKEDDSARISWTVGMTNPNFRNTFVVTFPVSYITCGHIRAQRTLAFFRACVTAYRPFWGCILNNRNALRFEDLWEENHPTSIQWVNYFNRSLVDRIGTNYIDNLDLFRVERVSDGLFIQIKEAPLDDDSEDDVALQRRIIEGLHL